MIGTRTPPVPNKGRLSAVSIFGHRCDWKTDPFRDETPALLRNWRSAVGWLCRATRAPNGSWMNSQVFRANRDISDLRTANQIDSSCGESQNHREIHSVARPAVYQVYRPAAKGSAMNVRQ